jgi:hypothetical protein
VQQRKQKDWSLAWELLGLDSWWQMEKEEGEKEKEKKKRKSF